MANEPRSRVGLFATACVLSLLGAIGLAWIDASAQPDAVPLSSRALRLDAVVDSLRFVSRADSAAVLVEAFLEEARQQADESATLSGLLLRGRAQAARGKTAQAERTYRDALDLAARLDDPVRQDEALLQIGITLDFQRRFSEAVEAFTRVRERAVARGDRAYEAQARQWLARRANFEGRFEEAKGELEWVIPVCAELGLERERANSYSLLGISKFQLLDLDGSAECFRRAVSLGREIGYPPVVGQGLNNLANVLYALGDPAATAAAFREAYELHTAAGNIRSSVVAGLNVGEADIRLGRFDEAEAIHRRLVEVCEEYELDEYLCASYNNLGMGKWKAGDNAEAVRMYRVAQREARRRNVRDEELKAVLGLARSLSALDSTEAGLALLMTRGNELRDAGTPSWQLELDNYAGAFYVALDRHEEAVTLLRQVDETARRSGLINFRLDTHANLADCYVALDRPDSAMAVLMRATGIWESQRQIPLDPKWREERGTRARQFYTTLADLQLDQPADLSEAQRTRAAFNTLQRFKARTLLERMTSPGSPIHTDTNLPDALDPVSLDRVQAEVLTEDELLLDFYQGPKTSVLFAVTRDQCRAVRLPGTDDGLGDKLDLLRTLASAPPVGGHESHDINTLREACESLGDILLRDVEDLVLAHPRVVFVPDGDLNLMSLAALRLGSGANTLLQDKEVLRVPSATVLAELRQAGRPRPGSGSNEPSSILAVAGAGGGGRPALGAARREVERIASRYEGVEVRSPGGAAAPKLETEELSKFAVVHLAGHTEVDDQNPWRSGILLAAAYEVEGASGLRARSTSGGEEPPGAEAAATTTTTTILRAQDIANLTLPTRLVVLSGCESAGGRVLSGEGVLGLTSAFLSAGVPAIVATLWPVDDEATARLMEHFYDALAAGATTGAALRQAQLALQAEPQTAAPFYWAGFVLAGDGSTRIELRERKGGLSNVVLSWVFAVGALYLMWLWIGPGRGRGPTPPTHEVHPEQLRDRA